MLEHGGRLREAARTFDIPVARWLDVSTGVNPVAYPVPPLPDSAWQRLPEEDDGLEQAAAGYYGSPALLPVAGTQAAIQALPTLIPGERVTLLAPMYAEHAHAWRKRRLHLCDATPGDKAASAAQIEAALPHTDVLVLANPNNPSGTCFDAAQLLDWHARLLEHNGWLIVDEAFIDPTPAGSIVPDCDRPNLVVLRSLGKFFGLAGARVGFVFARHGLRRALAQQLGPWAVSGPARHAARAALADHAWQAATRTQLLDAGARLAALLRDSGFGEPHGTALFQWVTTPRAEDWYRQLARQAVLVRLFDAPASLRFGLPADEAGWQHLQAALRACV